MFKYQISGSRVKLCLEHVCSKMASKNNTFGAQTQDILKVAIRGDGAILEVMGSKRPPLWGLIDVLLMLSSHMLGKPH